MFHPVVLKTDHDAPVTLSGLGHGGYMHVERGLGHLHQFTKYFFIIFFLFDFFFFFKKKLINRTNRGPLRAVGSALQ